ncbi:MAG: PAS domain-containing sensor histidine kinase [Saprospiraceae bacterium]|nr:PAS domain-containing sensor histidine kinase [Saprospiraceae bacterium]
MANNEYFLQFLQQLDEIFFIMDYPSLRHRYISPSVEKIRGYSPEEIYANPGIMYRRNTPEMTTRMMSLFQENIGKPPFVVEQQLETKHGELRWFSNSMMVLTTKEGEHLLVGLSRDITDRKNAEIELQELKKAYEDLYNNAPNGYHSLDGDGILLRINDTELNLLGYKRAELLGKRFFDIVIPAESRQEVQSHFAKFRELGVTKDYRLEVLQKDGSRIPVLINASFVKNEKGDTIYSRSILTDISELVKTEKELRQSQLAMEIINKELKQTNKKLERLNFTKDVLLKIISHDLRNPLETIKLVATLLNEKYEELDPDTVLKYLEYINETSINATDILDDMTEVVKLGDKIALQLTETALVPIIEEAVGKNQGFAAKKSIDIAVEKSAAQVQVKAKVDAKWLLRALDNLISNAIKFSQFGGSIRISCIQEGKKVLLRVEDKGIGISGKVLSELFTMSANQSQLGTAGERGTGLGLSIVKQIVDMMFGEIHVSSQEGEGSVFEIRFNALKGEA